MPSALQLFLGIDEGQIRRRGLAVDDHDLLAERFEHAGHAQFASQRVAIGADVAGEQKPLVGADEFQKRFQLIIADVGPPKSPQNVT